MRRIKLTFKSSVVRDEASVDVDGDLLKRAVAESRHRPGTALIGGRKIEVSRTRGLGEFTYWIGDRIIPNESIEAFLPSEYMEWRDN